MPALLTAVYDAYDTLKPFAAQDIDHEAICVTDDPTLFCEGWKMVVEPKPGVHPNRAAKSPKIRPWRYTDADDVVWIDASFRICSSSFMREVLDIANPIAQFVHWDRNCIYDEATYSAGMAKYAGEPLVGQTAAYRAISHPEHWGLWATGVIAYHRTPAVEAAGREWLHECERWSFQDQVSQPVCWRNHGLRPNTLPGTYYTNPWVRYEGSGRH